MSKYGYLKDGVVIATASAEGYAATDDSVKSLWRIVPAATMVGSRLSGTTWSHPAPMPEQRRLQISPVEFKMLFTSAERVAIRTAREGNDMILDDWFSIIDDPRLTLVDLALPQTLDGLDYLVAQEILTESRRDEIASGLPA